jgi:hypothetical protein
MGNCTSITLTNINDCIDVINEFEIANSIQNNENENNINITETLYGLIQPKSRFIINNNKCTGRQKTKVIKKIKLSISRKKRTKVQKINYDIRFKIIFTRQKIISNKKNICNIFFCNKKRLNNYYYCENHLCSHTNKCKHKLNLDDYNVPLITEPCTNHIIYHNMANYFSNKSYHTKNTKNKIYCENYNCLGFTHEDFKNNIVLTLEKGEYLNLLRCTSCTINNKLFLKDIYNFLPENYIIELFKTLQLLSINHGKTILHDKLQICERCNLGYIIFNDKTKRYEKCFFCEKKIYNNHIIKKNKKNVNLQSTEEEKKIVQKTFKKYLESNFDNQEIFKKLLKQTILTNKNIIKKEVRKILH